MERYKPQNSSGHNCRRGARGAETAKLRMGSPGGIASSTDIYKVLSLRAYIHAQRHRLAYES